MALEDETRFVALEMELQHARETLQVLKADRKRLKAEKFDLLNQMKALYGTLEDKERELRDFIRNYEQVSYPSSLAYVHGRLLQMHYTKSIDPRSFVVSFVVQLDLNFFPPTNY